jgi:hypothetical protein
MYCWFCVVNCLSIMCGMNNRKSDTKLLSVHTNFVQKSFYCFKLSINNIILGHLDTDFSWFPCVYKRMLRWFPSFQVATTCYSCSPPDLNFLVTDLICVYVYNNQCHRVTTQLRLINIIIIIIIINRLSYTN